MGAGLPGAARAEVPSQDLQALQINDPTTEGHQALPPRTIGWFFIFVVVARFLAQFTDTLEKIAGHAGIARVAVKVMQFAGILLEVV